MKKEQFIDGYVQKLMQDNDVRKYFDNAGDGERSALENGLKQSLDKAYDTYAKEYFESGKLGQYFSKFLRVGGAAADTLGTYMFWALGGAGFGFKGIGLAAKSIAEVLDYKRFAKAAKGDSTLRGAGNASEGLLENAAAYLPLGIGEVASLLRGTKKYDNSILVRALHYAKKDFIKAFGDYKPESNIIPIRQFYNPAYTIDDKVAA